MNPHVQRVQNMYGKGGQSPAIGKGITDKLRNLNHDIDLQSDSDLDNIRNSCNVFLNTSLIKMLSYAKRSEYLVFVSIASNKDVCSAILRQSGGREKLLCRKTS